MAEITYSYIGVLAIIVCIIVNWDALINRKNKNTSVAITEYGRFLCAVLLYFVTDVLWGIFSDFETVELLWADTFIYYIAMSLAVVCWSDYVVIYLKQKNSFGNFVKIFGRVFLITEVVFLIANIRYPVFFWFDAEGIYYAGIIRHIMLYIQVLMFFLTGIQTIYVFFNSKGIKRRRNLSIGLVSFSMSITIGIQVIYPLIPAYTIGLLVSTCFIHVFVREDEREEEFNNLSKQMSIVSSMAGIYYCSYYADLKSRTYIQIDNKIAENATIIGESGDTKTVLEKLCTQLVLPEYRKEVEEFVDLDTISERLKNKYYISTRFESVHLGWAEGVFIAGDRDTFGNLKHVIWAIRTINDEKAKEDRLFYNSYIDELTGLYNRKMYSEDVYSDSKTNLADSVNSVDINRDDFIYMSMDVNGLKEVNDNKGHAAGDELIIAAAESMKKTIGRYGRVYRTGGDEFVALLNTSLADFKNAMKEFEEITSNHTGKYIDAVSVSCGYVIKNKNSSLSFAEIEKLADKKMYEAKSLHYSSFGVDRRTQQKNAQKALCMLYNKILMINLSDASYSIISMDESERKEEFGFRNNIFDWLKSFAESGLVHPEDTDKYLLMTDKQFLSEYFRNDKTSLSFTYRRKTGSEFKLSEMQIIPADDYSNDNQNMFLYVKNIDK